MFCIFIAFLQLKITFLINWISNLLRTQKRFVYFFLRPMTPSNDSDSESEKSSAYGSLEQWNSHQILVIFKHTHNEMHAVQGREADHERIWVKTYIWFCFEEKLLIARFCLCEFSLTMDNLVQVWWMFITVTGLTIQDQMMSGWIARENQFLLNTARMKSQNIQFWIQNFQSPSYMRHLFDCWKFLSQQFQ